MNNQFTTYRLGEVADIIAGGDKPKVFSLDKTELAYVPVLANAEKSNGLLGYTDTSRITEPAVTLAARGSNVGFVAVRKEPFFPVVRLLSLIPDKERLDVDYLFYNLKQNRKKGTGSGQPQITIPDISGKTISMPSLSEQKKVAKVLSTLDEKIELNNRINTELEAIAKTLYDYWFVQFDFPDANGKPYKSSGGKMVYNAVLKREIPEGWSDKTLSQIANITMGQSPAGSSYNEEGIGTIFYQGSTDFGWLFPSTRQYTTAPSRMAKKGDILLSVRAPVGDMNIANTDCCIGRGLATLNSKTGSDGFLFYVMKYFKQIFDRRNSEGTTFGSITKNDLHSLTLAHPTADLLEKYDEVVTNYNKMIFERSLENRELVSLRDWLLPMLMNGQVTVKPSTESKEAQHG
ncbi:restriction endonuclease subunit S [Vibrio sp. M250220]|uniref:restriction endonuclease subunit S n=1 Tax=Vibrio sp. M250220 TaxID=3020894 RepID=UPI002F419513